jgi:hypothetical protein
MTGEKHPNKTANGALRLLQVFNSSNKELEEIVRNVGNIAERVKNFKEEVIDGGVMYNNDTEDPNI